MGNLFSWGGKGGDPTPPVPAMPDYGAQVGDMMGAMQEMIGGVMAGMAEQMAAAQEQQQSMLASMQLPDMPEPYRDPEIDFTEQQDRLAAKARADYNLDQVRRKGRTDTILSSPLLDEEEPVVGGSILEG